MINKIENLKFIISRIDTYIESSQNKNNILLALNTIMLGGIITLFTSDVETNCFMSIVLGCISILATISILLTIKSIFPYLNGADNNSQSIIFFKDINKKNLNDYKEQLLKINEDRFIDDLAGQIHSLSKGLNKKYKSLNINSWIVSVEFVLLLIWFISLLTLKN